MDYTENLSKFIKYKREKSRLSLNKFCIESKIETSSLSRYETRKRIPSVISLVKIAKFYNQSLSEFLKKYEKFLNDKKNS